MKILFDTIEARLLPYPRKDGKPIKGLAAHLVVLNVVQESPPEYDADTEVLEEVSTVDVPARECRKSWVARPKPPREWPTVTEFWQALPEHARTTLATTTVPGLKRLVADFLAWRYRVIATHPDIQAGVTALRDAGVMSASECETLLGYTLP